MAYDPAVPLLAVPEVYDARSYSWRFSVSLATARRIPAASYMTTKEKISEMANNAESKPLYFPHW